MPPGLSQAATPPLPDAVLDAARDCLMAVGVRRTTLTDVARRARVSRMTLYRHYPDLTAILQALMTREFGAVIADSVAATASLPTARERLVERTVRAVDGLRRHPLFVRLLDVDPELLLPYVTDRHGDTQRTALALILEALREGHADGSIRAGNEVAMAHTLLLAAQSQVLSSHSLRGVPRAALAAELRAALDGALRPAIVRPAARRRPSSPARPRVVGGGEPPHARARSRGASW